MAYTYEDIVAEARKAGVYESFTQEDLTVSQQNPEYGISLVGLLQDINNATTEEQRLLATETANMLRTSYGVTGSATTDTGTSFSEEQRLVAPEESGSLDSSDSDTYKTVLDDIINQKKFSYDPEQDPLYESYAKTYMREGRRASENVLAQAAAMTGGRPSSYAINAAQQAGNYYAAQLADAVPTLRENAYSEYLNDFANKQNILSLLQGQSDAGAVDTPSFSVTNQTGGEGDNTWVMVGDIPLSYTELEMGLANNAIIAEYDYKTGTVTYTWKSGMEPAFEPDPEEYGVVNEHGGSGSDAWIWVGGLKLTWDGLLEALESGQIVAQYDATQNAFRYSWKNAHQSGGKDIKLTMRE